MVRDSTIKAKADQTQSTTVNRLGPIKFRKFDNFYHIYIILSVLFHRDHAPTMLRRCSDDAPTMLYP